MCIASAQIVWTVAFQYHMYGATMGTLRLVNANGVAVWSRDGNQGNTWHSASVLLFSPSFRFEYVRGSSYTGDAAVAQVNRTYYSLRPMSPSCRLT